MIWFNIALLTLVGALALLHLGTARAQVRVAILDCLKVDDGIYSVPLGEAVRKRLGFEVSVSALFATLERLESEGLVVSWYGAPMADRDYRAPRYYRKVGP